MISRRQLLAAAAGAAPALAFGVAKNQAMRPLKFCVFADLHFETAVYPHDTPEFLERILARAERERCDFAVHLGDFTHHIDRPGEKNLIALYNDFRIPTYGILGNHDQDHSSWRATVEAYRMPGGYYSFDRGGFRFVVADPNYFCPQPGEFVHHDNGNYHRRGKGSTIDWIPPEQLEWMRSVIVGSPLPCVVLSHQSFERAPFAAGVSNAEAVRAIFAEANAKKPGTVRLVMNGHNHIDNLRVLDDILYWDVNSANFQWFPKSHGRYPAEFTAGHDRANWTIAWTKPLSAIVTLYPNGRIRIDGAKAEFAYGLTPVQAGLPAHDACGRYTVPEIRSCDLTFNFRG